jgi:hypothetical protein
MLSEEVLMQTVGLWFFRVTAVPDSTDTGAAQCARLCTHHHGPYIREYHGEGSQFCEYARDLIGR